MSCAWGSAARVGWEVRLWASGGGHHNLRQTHGERDLGGPVPAVEVSEDSLGSEAHWTPQHLGRSRADLLIMNVTWAFCAETVHGSWGQPKSCKPLFQPCSAVSEG